MALPAPPCSRGGTTAVSPPCSRGVSCWAMHAGCDPLLPLRSHNTAACWSARCSRVPLRLRCPPAAALESTRCYVISPLCARGAARSAGRSPRGEARREGSPRGRPGRSALSSSQDLDFTRPQLRVITPAARLREAALGSPPTSALSFQALDEFTRSLLRHLTTFSARARGAARSPAGGRAASRDVCAS